MKDDLSRKKQQMRLQEIMLSKSVERQSEGNEKRSKNALVLTVC